MSKYTTELRYPLEAGADIGLKDYPIFDEDYREILNNKIIEHFYFREIGFETFALFKRFLNRKMNEIMVYYNQMYKSQLIEFDPMTDYDVKHTSKHTNTGETITSGTNKGFSSDTPMGKLGNIYSEEYASESDKSETNSTGNVKSEETLTDETKGKSGGASRSKLLQEYRETFLNIDMLIIDELEPLFFGLW